MKCHTPGCSGEREARAISQSVIYRERTVVVLQLPADICPECGDARLSEETTIHLALLLGRKSRAKGAAFVYEVT